VKRPSKRKAGKSAVDILEESVHMLRTTPFILVPYYIGSLPFILGLLYFWTDMSTGANAWQHCSQAAWGMVLLFIWMKTWQSVYERRLLAQIRGETPPSWGIRRILRAAGIQTAIQPWSIIILPFAFIIMLPFPQTFAFFQNATLIGSGDEGNMRIVIRHAWQQASLWPMQNTLIIWLASPFMLLFVAIILFVLVSAISSHYPVIILNLLNIIIQIFIPFCPLGIITALNIGNVVFLIPVLLKTLFGIDTIFSLSGIYYIVNATFFAVVCGLSYLCLDPLMKASYCLRCFYGESLHTGEDLKVELRSLARPGVIAAVVLALLLALGPMHYASAESHTAGVTSNNSPIGAQELDTAIERTINHPKYTWRMPREKPPEDTDGENAVHAFLRPIINAIKDGLQYIVKGMTKTLNFIQDMLSRITPSLPILKKPDTQWTPWSRALIIILPACLLALLAFFVWRAWKKRRPRILEEALDSLGPTLDITREDVDATALPEEGWLKLARKLMEQGELRLALRALYLATLAFLAQQGLITIAQYKSDREYEWELRRRSHAQPQLVGVFAENRALFERSWYGLHEVTAEIIERFSHNQKQIRADAQR
jgi:hypothetical protein